MKREKVREMREGRKKNKTGWKKTQNKLIRMNYFTRGQRTGPERGGETERK